jgi:hyperosmotically inducible protein
MLIAFGMTAEGTSPTIAHLPNLSQYAPLDVSSVSTFGENAIEGQVHRELLRLAYFGVFDHLTFTVKGNTVILHGQAFHPSLLEDATEAAWGCIGVNDVVNLITLLPDSPADNRIRLAVFTAIYSQPSLSIYSNVGGGGAIHIVVQSGHVSLEGQVGSNADARRAVLRASGVTGVVSITSHLNVVVN